VRCHVGCVEIDAQLVFDVVSDNQLIKIVVSDVLVTSYTSAFTTRCSLSVVSVQRSDKYCDASLVDIRRC